MSIQSLDNWIKYIANIYREISIKLMINNVSQKNWPLTVASMGLNESSNEGKDETAIDVAATAAAARFC